MTAIWRAFFVCSVVLLTLLALSVPSLDFGTPAFVVSVLSAGMLGTMLVLSAVFIYTDWDPFEELFEHHV